MTNVMPQSISPLTCEEVTVDKLGQTDWILHEDKLHRIQAFIPMRVGRTKAVQIILLPATYVPDMSPTRAAQAHHERSKVFVQKLLSDTCQRLLWEYRAVEGKVSIWSDMTCLGTYWQVAKGEWSVERLDGQCSTLPGRQDCYRFVFAQF